MAAASGRFIVFDVETPNARNDRMSAIGIAVIENGRIVDELETLVNPETYFAPFNIALTGISPADAADAPAFPQLWEAIGPLMQSGLLVAHNAPFDMSVLGKCLRDYGLPHPDTLQYACTCRMSRRLMPSLPDHRLNTLCDALNIPLDHHRAGSDSRACGEILLHLLRSGADPAPFIRRYDLRRMCTVPAGR